MSKNYSFPVLYLDNKKHDWRGPTYTFHNRVQAWKNFMDECDGDIATAVTWLANEWNATFVVDTIIFENEQDKIMWILRWS